MSVRRLAKKWRKNRTFIFAATALSLIAGVMAAFIFVGVDELFSRASLVDKAMRTPGQLTGQEKAELQKIYDGLSQAEKEKARKFPAP